jgi:hypothetical protein
LLNPETIVAQVISCYIPTYGRYTVPWLYNHHSGPRSRNPVQGRICIIKALQGNLASLLGLEIPPPLDAKIGIRGNFTEKNETNMTENECIITYNNNIHGIYYVFHEGNTGKFGQKTTKSPYPTNNATEHKNRKYLLQINKDKHAKT